MPLQLTHAMLSDLVAARRPTVTKALGELARQAQQWPEGSEEEALVLTAVARFLAAHTPTRRELPTVVRIATRLRRGEALYEEDTVNA